MPPNPTAMPNITAGLPAQVYNNTFEGSLQNQYLDCQSILFNNKKYVKLPGSWVNLKDNLSRFTIYIDTQR